ncbi:MAG: UDP-N-acetylglucosamine 2-epimerase (non-hydrolyzing) [Desulfobacteraceae bacterium]|nr:MAG: UDP-N-acetylglucosamine 2-epimerase (non-hydrolyzing) [Desulfobacteraceae bacterium]
MRIHLVAAARPNFMKIAPVFHELKKRTWARPIIVHTGQHYHLNMSDAFFVDLDLPPPDIHLGVGSGSHAEQTGKVMIAYEKILLDRPADLVIVVGDVNSTLAATLASVKLGCRVAHLEAGLRSFDRSMPEEINRILTDAVADILWTPSADGDENLLHEGISPDKIARVGNIMIDSLEMLRPRIESKRVYQEFGLQKNRYGIVTLHRPANVDAKNTLQRIVDLLGRISRKLPLIFSVHPRTMGRLKEFALLGSIASTQAITLAEPQSYMRFMNLVFNCRIAITDSGGIQEETTYMGIPCLTLRPNTERPITVTQGTNKLSSIDALEENVEALLDGRPAPGKPIELWDGNTAVRIADDIYNRFFNDKRNNPAYTRSFVGRTTQAV